MDKEEWLQKPRVCARAFAYECASFSWISTCLCTYGGREVLLGDPVWQRNYLRPLPLMSVQQHSTIFFLWAVGALMISWQKTFQCSSLIFHHTQTEAKNDFLLFLFLIRAGTRKGGLIKSPFIYWKLMRNPLKLHIYLDVPLFFLWLFPLMNLQKIKGIFLRQEFSMSP